jgi:hypothetical protein
LRKRAVLVLIILGSALLAAGCASPSTTPTGYPCTKPPSQINQTQDCYYFIKNGSAIACKYTRFNLCQNAAGDYYDYSSYYDHTFLCGDHVACFDGREVAVPRLCSPKFAYDHLANGGQAWQVVNQQEDQNSSRQPIDIKFISTSASTVSTRVSAGVTVGADALLGIVYASVQAQVNASVTRTVSTVVGNEVAVTIPPHMTAFGIYGVNMQVTSGHLYQTNSCGAAKPNYGEVKTYVPIDSGWCVWLSGQQPCRVVPKS